MKARLSSPRGARLTATVLSALILALAVSDFYRVASVTGDWRGGFSFKWALNFLAFCIFALTVFRFAWLASWSPARLGMTTNRLLAFRARLGKFRFGFVALVLVFPIGWLQFTYWGVVFNGAGLRILLWTFLVLACSFLLTSSAEKLILWPAFFAATLLLGGVIAAAVPLTSVTDHPFALGWSEGNRLWDYSMLFGRDLYTFAPAQQPDSFIDFGRQLIGGIPFLFPHVSILQERLWVALMAILPCIFLGWAIFYDAKIPRAHWLLAGLFTFLFLRQGPIHAPLLIAATLVALTWRRSMPLAIAALILATTYIAFSRITWLFAPAIWMGMLSLVGSEASPPTRQDWRRAITLTAVGFLSAVLIPTLRAIAHDTTLIAKAGVAIGNQPLLWYRLLPNSTFSGGILVSLLLACLPLLVILIYLIQRNQWALSRWQKLALILPLLAFLAVGLIASTKIGGGGDLHNMDMFLVSLVFIAGLALRKNQDLFNMASPFLRGALMILIILPSIFTLLNLRPLLHAEDLQRIKTLTGRADDPYNDPRIFGFLPSQAETDEGIALIQNAVQRASQYGEILFMDQRQLLTFGFVPQVPLVTEYEKKLLIDQAMSSNAKTLLAQFHKDLAAHRFVLIITDPLRTPIKDSAYHFGEENNAWVTWIADPIQCYYRPWLTLDSLRVQLLIPRTQSLDCNLP